MKWFWLSALVILLDQITKYVADRQLSYHAPVDVFPGLNMMLAYNKGAAFSFLSDAGGWQRGLFITLSSVISIALIVWILKTDAHRRWLLCGMALILGGAIGNLIDRSLYGYVIDFIDVYYKNWHWPAFNIADSAISVGAGCLIMDMFKHRDSDRA